MTAQALVIAQQALLIPVGIGLVVALAPAERLRTAAGGAFLGLAGVAYLASGAFHGVLGAHLVAAFENPEQVRGVTIAQASVVHALGDTNYAVGLVAGAIALAVLSPAIRRSPGLPPGLARLGLVVAVIQLLQFGWFVVVDLGAAAPVAALLQGAWFVWLGRRLYRLSEAPAIS